MICEFCKNNHDGTYGSGRFCCKSCSTKYSSRLKRDEINKKLSKKMKGWKTVPGGRIRLCEYGCRKEAKIQLDNGKWCCESIYQQCPSNKKKNSKGLKKSYKEGKTSKNRFSKEARLKGHENYRKKLQLYYSTLLFEDKPNAEKRRILIQEQNNTCSICGLPQIWNNKPLNFHFDHIDGNNQNELRENIRLICPNCHSQTNTYCRNTKFKRSDDEIKNAIIKYGNIHKALISLNLVPGGTNWQRAKKIYMNNIASVA